MIQVGDTVRVKVPEGASHDLRWEEDGACGRVIGIVGMAGDDRVLVAWDGEETGVYFKRDRVERVEPEAPAADDDTTITVSSGNPYADLGLSNPEQRLAEARNRIAQQHDSVETNLSLSLWFLRQALAVSSRAGDSVTRLVALTGLIGHVDRCVRELPE